MTKDTIGISLIVGSLIVLGAVLFAGSKVSPAGSGGTGLGEGENVYMENGKQIIEITAKGGYYPRATTAKAGVPTVIRMNTKGTFDCSSALNIPKIGFQKFLPSAGKTDIDISAEQASGTLQGICSMGMYNFGVAFQ
jgi:plastocyanin domain-containing protein